MPVGRFVCLVVVHGVCFGGRGCVADSCLRNACICFFFIQFESLFTQKPTLFSKFWASHKNPEEVLQVGR